MCSFALCPKCFHSNCDCFNSSEILQMQMTGVLPGRGHFHIQRMGCSSAWHVFFLSLRGVNYLLNLQLLWLYSYSCNGVFTDRSIFSLNLSEIQIPTGTSVTNCNLKHRLMLTCWHHVDMFTWGCIVLSLLKPAHVDWNWPISREKYHKIDWSVNMLLHWLIMGRAGS